MRSEEREFIVRLRKVQWMLDDVAYQIPKNRYGAVEFHALADALEDLAVVVRQRGRNDPLGPTARLLSGFGCRERAEPGCSQREDPGCRQGTDPACSRTDSGAQQTGAHCSQRAAG